MSALKRIRELKAQTKMPCVNPNCQDGTHYCDSSGDWEDFSTCCSGCKTVQEAFRHLNNLRIEYFERAVEALEYYREFMGMDGAALDAVLVLDAIEIDVKAALEVK